MSGVPHRASGGSSSFQHIANAFFAEPGLPLARLLSAEQIEDIFAKHGRLFGGIYTTAVIVWAFLGQVLRDGKEAACQAAVARITTHCLVTGTRPPTGDTGDYCKARAKLPVAALHELSTVVAEGLQEQAQDVWLFKGRHAKLVDGFTFTMPDTVENQAEFPQAKTQQPGIGFPIARAVAVLSLATACVLEAAMGPYSGKETGESALLRQLLHCFRPGDVAVLDRYYCSFLMIALLLAKETDVCTRLHQRRHCDFRRGQRLGKYDHLIEWTRPLRPAWMDPAVYETIPPTMTLRELRFNVVEKGRRTKTMTIVTTLTDAKQYTKEEIAELYGFRWNSELDIRSIKDALNLAHVRCKSPAMVRREVWTTLLAYNLIRTTAAAAALLHDKQPRQLGFTSTCQYVLASWAILSAGLIAADQLVVYCLSQLEQIAACEVANRPGRLEPRVLKRRRHGYKLMRKPRHVLRQELENRCK